MKKSVQRLITFEEHYVSAKVNEAINKIIDIKEREKIFDEMNRFISKTLLTNLDGKKIGVVTQINGYGGNSPFQIKRMKGIRLLKMANDEIYEGCKKYPGRLLD